MNETNTTIYLVAKRDGTKIPFVGTDLVDARKKARDLAGVGYRYLTFIGPTHPDRAMYERQLGM